MVELLASANALSSSSAPARHHPEVGYVFLLGGDWCWCSLFCTTDPDLVSAAVHSEQLRRRGRKALVREWLGPRRWNHRTQGRSWLSSGLAPRWRPFWIVA